MDKVKAGLVFFLAVLLMLNASAAVWAQDEEIVDPQSQEESAGEADLENEPIDPLQQELDNLSQYFDQYLREQMENYNIPGLAFAYVYQGEVVTGGYGFADMDNEIPIDPSATLFPMEDIAKSFTAAAVLQLSERGAVDLDADVNLYLNDFMLPERFSRPLTLRNILTHTSGFAESSIGAYALEAEDIKPLKDYLADIPPWIYSPGKASTYGDYGYGLAGLVVQEISGEDFGEYMKHNLLAPLAMDQSIFRMDAAASANAAKGYVEVSGELIANDPAYPRNLPASALMGTVRELANFLIMHLNDGVFNNRQILSEESLNLMHNLQYVQHPKLSGWTLGLFQHKANGQRVLMHGGDSELGYSTIMFFLPDADFGMVVAINRCMPALGIKLINDFIHWRYPVENSGPIKPAENAVDRSRWFIGNYTLDYPTWNSFASLRRLFTQIHVNVDEAGVFHIDFPPELDLPTEWVEVEPLLMRAVDQEKYIAFIDDPKGNITHLYAGGIYNYTKLPWIKTTEVTLIAFLAFTAVFVLQLLIWLVRKIRNRRMRTRPLDRFHQNMAMLISVINLLFIGGLVFYLWNYSQELLFGTSPVLYGVMALPFVSIALTLLLLVIGSSINKRRWSFGLRVYHFGLGTIFVAFLVYLWTWNLIGF